MVCAEVFCMGKNLSEAMSSVLSSQKMKNEDKTGCITDVPGIMVGSVQSPELMTGCTVVLFKKGAIAGIDIGGSAPGTRETELLNPTNMIFQCTLFC